MQTHFGGCQIIKVTRKRINRKYPQEQCQLPVNCATLDILLGSHHKHNGPFLNFRHVIQWNSLPYSLNGRSLSGSPFKNFVVRYKIVGICLALTMGPFY